ncbi:hypothetical protein DES39_0526 [Orbus hercynius]|uniref:Uncharacterized protein n=1 Tax=Orbus hercynius TaxID=593135 RepID=A0A495RJG5_9GAMM|nr:hypothetical protein [Orbus hercynius]RKS87306.1 hypothetical protein DES39_0526 [Orbus hercynius]
MTKPTLDDFLKNQNQSMRDGYYPDFMSCLSLKASSFSFKEFRNIKDEFFWILNQEAYMFPIYFLVLLFYAIAVVTTPFLFPVNAFIYWMRTKGAYRRYHERMKNKPKLMINGVEQ